MTLMRVKCLTVGEITSLIRPPVDHPCLPRTPTLPPPEADLRPLRPALALAAGCALIASSTAAVASDVVASTAVTTVAAAADPPPGPDILNAPPARAPQLENTGIWKAAPTMVCHTSAYRQGEFVHQGCVYDDQGAQLIPTNWPEHSILHAYTYPKNPVYRANAADIVEVRVKPLDNATAVRVTFNTMLDPELVGTTIALGDSAAPRTAPHGANTVMKASTFVTVHGTTADAVNASTGATLTAPTVTVDKERRQIEVRVPHSVFDPGARTVPLRVASGLWDSSHDRFLVPQLLADEDTPGGAVPTDLSPSAYFDVAFRNREPFDSPWRNDLQKKALAAGDISQFSAAIDFSKLASAVNDDLTGTAEGVPTSGFMERLYASHFETRQGRRLPSDPGGPPVGALTQQNGPADGEGDVSVQFGWVCRDDCVPDLPGQLQRYVAYVPKMAAPRAGYASLIWTPGYAQTANDQVGDPGTGALFPAGDKDLFHKFANRTGAPTVVISVDGRGNDEWYYGQSGASVFEAIADARRAFPLDPARTVMSGFSSCAYGANKLSLQFPDVFSKAFICDGLNKAPSFPGINGIVDVLPLDTLTEHEPGSTLTPLLPSRRNQPVIEWAGLPNTYIPYDIPRERAQACIAGDYHFNFVTWIGLSSDHVILCANGTWDVATQWLGDMRGVTKPFHVTYVRNPAMDDPQSGLVGDRAYWLSDIQTRVADPRVGTIDVVSRAFGLKDAPKASVVTKAGVEEGTTVPLNPYTSESRTPLPPIQTAAANSLDITATNIASVTIDPEQSKVSCSVTLNVTTDGPLTVHLIGCGDRQFG